MRQNAAFVGRQKAEDVDGSFELFSDANSRLTTFTSVVSGDNHVRQGKVRLKFAGFVKHDRHWFDTPSQKNISKQNETISVVFVQEI